MSKRQRQTSLPGLTILLLAFAMVVTAGSQRTMARDNENPIIADPPPQQRSNSQNSNRGGGVVDGFFRSIFGVRRAPSNSDRTRQRQIQQIPASGVTLPATQPAPIIVEEKVLNAEIVVVFGGSYARDVADGLDEAFADTNNVRIERRIHRRSGLIGDEPVNWIDELQAFLDSGDRIDAAVIAIGLNDLKPLSDTSGQHAPLTERWRGLYGERIDKLLLTLAPRQIPIVWVGLPPVADTNRSSDYLSLNSVYRIRSQSAAGTFVDIWQSFVNEDGAYAVSGPDIEGQERVLRDNDGIGFTRSGSRKLGFFVERPLRRILRPDALDTPIANVPEAFDVEEVIAEERQTGIGRITALTNQGVPTGIDLINAASEDVADASAETDDTYHNLFVEGDVDIERSGRANDFAWPRGPEAGADPEEP